ncbi:hypothetical protein D3C84_918630 [compost metagenome]
MLGQVANVRTLGQLNTHRQIVAAKALGRQAQLLQVAPVRSHPEKQHETDHDRDHQVGHGEIERHQARLCRQLDAQQLRTVVNARDELCVLLTHHHTPLGQLGLLLRGQGHLIALDQGQAQAVVRPHGFQLSLPGRTVQATQLLDQ